MSSRPYLEPADVTPENARLVLEFLNGAQSAREIADAVELPGEPDIGIRLAQRILNERVRLGGFSELRQLREIPLIGPERFTEIVVSLSGQRPPVAADPLAPLRAELDELRRQLEAPRSQGGAGPPGRRLTLRAVQPEAMLGQPVTVVATLTEGETPAVDVPVTFVATRGLVRANDGYDQHEGHLITARTAIDGTVRLVVRPATSEALSAEQQAALASMLLLLDPKAPRPTDIAPGLRLFAQQYAWEVNLPFRQAVDIYVRDFRPALLDTVNFGDAVYEWSHHDSAVLAFAPLAGDGQGGSSVAATAALHLRVRDWIAPFLEAFVALSRDESNLTDELRDVVATETDPGRMVTGIYERAGRFVATRHGRVGAWVGKKVAEASIRTVVDKELAQLPPERRIAVAPALDGASRIMATAEPAVIGSVVGTRRDLQRDLDARGGAQAGVLGDLAGRFEVLETNVRAMPGKEALEGVRGELLRAVAAARSELSLALDQTRTSFNSSIEQIRTDIKTRVSGAQLEVALQPMVTRTEMNTALQPMVTRTEMNTALQPMVTRTEMNTALQPMVTRTEMNTALQPMATRTEMNGALATKVDTGTFTGFQTNVNQRFGNVNTNITNLNTRLERG